MGLMGKAIAWFFMKDELKEYDDINVPVISFRNFVLDERVLNGTPFFRPSKKYVRDLQACYKQLMNYLGEHSLLNVDSLREQYNLLHEHSCELERMLAKTQGDCEALRIQLNAALEWQTTGGQKNQVLTENGFAPQQQKEQPKDGTRFTSKSGRTALENKKLVAAMTAYDIAKADIAKELELSIATVNSYRSSTNGNYYTMSADDAQWIVFTGELGNDKWNLDEMYGDRYSYVEVGEEQQEQAIGFTTLPQEMGTIHHGLEKPYIYGK